MPMELKAGAIRGGWPRGVRSASAPAGGYATVRSFTAVYITGPAGRSARAGSPGIGPSGWRDAGAASGVCR